MSGSRAVNSNKPRAERLPGGRAVRVCGNQKGEHMREISNCDSCANFIYDEDEDYYVCDMNLDEDDMVRFLTGTFESCPYYQSNDEYEIVRHQM